MLPRSYLGLWDRAVVFSRKPDQARATCKVTGNYSMRQDTEGVKPLILGSGCYEVRGVWEDWEPWRDSPMLRFVENGRGFINSKRQRRWILD